MSLTREFNNIAASAAAGATRRRGERPGRALHQAILTAHDLDCDVGMLRNDAGSALRRALADDEDVQHLLTQVQQRQAQQRRTVEAASSRQLLQRDANGDVAVVDSDNVAIAAGVVGAAAAESDAEKLARLNVSPSVVQCVYAFVRSCSKHE